MSQPVHIEGPLKVDGQNITTTQAEIGIAKVYGNLGQPLEANARLLAAAYNAFDSAARELNLNAVLLAEQMAANQKAFTHALRAAGVRFKEEK